MKKIGLSILLLLALVLLCACSNNDNTEETEYYIYTLNSSETGLEKQAYELEVGDTLAMVEQLVIALNETPKDVTCKQAISEEVHLPVCVIPDGTTALRLNFDDTYTKMTGAEETLRRAAIVKTLCQVPNISGVEFYVDQVALQEDGKVVGVMTENSFVEGSNFQTRQNIVLCYADEDYDALIAVDATADYDGSTSLEKVIIDQLIAGPDNIADLNNTLYSVIPQDTVCNSIVTLDYCCYVDLSSEFLNKVEEVSDELVVYSIVNSLTSLPAVNKVKFTIDGAEVQNYGKISNFDQYFEINYDLIKES